MDTQNQSTKILQNFEWRSYYTETFPLSEGYPMIGAEYLLLAEVLYGLLILWGLSRQRADAPPLIKDGRWILRIYNSGQVLLSGYIALLATTTFLYRGLSEGRICMRVKVDIASDPGRYELETFTNWLFYMSKWADFLDTFFIIARGKWRQFTFLHLFHHSSIIVFSWVVAHYHPCGYSLIVAQFNAPVHFVMYFYYLLSSFSTLVPFLWWKKYITSLQLLQFSSGVIINSYCMLGRILGYHDNLNILFFSIYSIYVVTLFKMFSSFYRSSYTKDQKIRSKIN